MRRAHKSQHLAVGGTVHTQTSDLHRRILKMQGCELGLEKQMFSFGRRREAEKLVESSHPRRAVKPREIFICPQAGRQKVWLQNLAIFGQNCIFPNMWKLLQRTRK